MVDRDMTPLGDYIRQLRESREMTIADLQRAMNAAAGGGGMSWSTIKAWETKGVVPDRGNTALLIRALELTQEEQQGLAARMGSVGLAASKGPTSTGPSSPSPTPPSPGRTTSSARAARAAADRDAISKVVTEAFKQGGYDLMDGIAVIDALSDSGGAFQTLEPEHALAAAKAWLDAATWLRAKGIPVTAASLAVALPAAGLEADQTEKSTR